MLANNKAGMLTKDQIVSRREKLEHEENLIYLGIVPPTSGEAVKAETALRTNQDSTTTDEEIALLVSENLQIS